MAVNPVPLSVTRRYLCCTFLVQMCVACVVVVCVAAHEILVAWVSNVGCLLTSSLQSLFLLVLPAPSYAA